MGTSATQEDKTGETWKLNVTAENCWEDLILTLGTSTCSGCRYRIRSDVSA